LCTLGQIWSGPTKLGRPPKLPPHCRSRERAHADGEGGVGGGLEQHRGVRTRFWGFGELTERALHGGAGQAVGTNDGSADRRSLAPADGLVRYMKQGWSSRRRRLDRRVDGVDRLHEGARWQKKRQRGLRRSSVAPSA
jgi:hypothetical protein